MGQTATWKPCTSLTPADFAAFPIWTFDLNHEGDVDADETWVRPVGPENFTDVGDVLFVRADLSLSDERQLPGVVLLRLGKGSTFEQPNFDSIEVMALVTFDPGYRVLMPNDTNGRAKYHATLRLGETSHTVRGII